MRAGCYVLDVISVCLDPPQVSVTYQLVRNDLINWDGFFFTDFRRNKSFEDTTKNIAG